MRVYDSTTKDLLRVYQNPEAQLDFPHGLVMTNRHIILSNKHRNINLPSRFNVYRIGDPSAKPVTVFTTPVKHLREAHSLTLRDGLLLVTYSGKGIGAIVSYRFDDEEGKISGPISILKSYFAAHGNPKGVCFNKEGTKVVVTLGTAKLTDYISKLLRINRLLKEKGGIRRTIKIVLSKFTKLNLDQNNKSDKAINHSNGVVIFDVDENGVLSKTPVQTLLRSRFCRLENVSIVKDLCILADPVNNAVYIYNFDGDHFPDSPVQVIQDHLSFPHDACLSPDKKMLVVSNYGMAVVNDRPQWGKFLHPRSDKLTIYELRE